MRTRIDILVVAIFSIAVFQGGKYGLKKTANYIQMLALEKAAQGLGSLEGVLSREKKDSSLSHEMTISWPHVVGQFC